MAWTGGPLRRSFLILGVRPESFIPSTEGSNAFPVTVNLVEALGNDTFIYAHLVTEPDLTIQARIAPDHPLQVGEQLWLTINPEKIHLFDAKTEQAIDQR